MAQTLFLMVMQQFELFYLVRFYQEEHLKIKNKK
jgi:hypothetical protein